MRSADAEPDGSKAFDSHDCYRLYPRTDPLNMIVISLAERVGVRCCIDYFASGLQLPSNGRSYFQVAQTIRAIRFARATVALAHCLGGVYSLLPRGYCHRTSWPCKSVSPRADDSLGVVPYCAVRVGLRGLCASARLNPLAFHNRRTRRQTGGLLVSSGILLLVWSLFDRSRPKPLRDRDDARHRNLRMYNA